MAKCKILTHIWDAGQCPWGFQSSRCCWHRRSVQPVSSQSDHLVQTLWGNPGSCPPSRASWPPSQLQGPPRAELHWPPPLCYCHWKTFFLLLCGSRQSNRGVCQRDQSPEPPRLWGPAGWASRPLHLLKGSSDSSGCWRWGKVRCCCSAGRCVHPALWGNPGRTCTHMSQQCFHRSDCTRWGSLNTRRCHRTSFCPTWDGIQEGKCKWSW